MKIKQKWNKVTGIYCIKNVLNNKCYIGSSINILGRLTKHRSLLRHNKHENQYLQNAWNKYGEDYFTCYIISQDLNIEDLLLEEQKWIDVLGNYNLSKDTVRNSVSEASKLKMSITRKARIATGAIVKQNTKAIKQYSIDGTFIQEFTTITSASKACNISTCQIRRVLQKKHVTAGKFQWKYSTDTSEILEYKGRDYTSSILQMQRQVLVLDTFTGIYHEFESYKACGNFFNVASQTIAKAMKNKRNLYKNRYLVQDLKKQDELLGYPTTVRGDNQQPSLSSNTLEGSTTNTRFLPDNAEESNGNTSVLPLHSGILDSNPKAFK